jgi:hypothetical protein
LKKHGLWKAYLKGIYTSHDNDNDNDNDNDSIKSKKERNKQREKEVYGTFENVLLSSSDYSKLLKKYGDRQTQTIIDKLSSYKEANGKKYKSDMAAITQWVLDAVKPVPLPPPPEKCSG